jgi:hypothetical protein
MKNYILYLLFLSSFSLTAQDKFDTAVSFIDRTEFKIGYTGNFIWNNGLNFGAEYLWKEKVKNKERREKQKTITHQILFNGNLAFTNNFSSKTDAGIITNYGLTWRRTNTKGKQINIAFNPLGYYRSFLPETYEVDGDKVNKVFLPGRSYLAPSISIGLGKLREGKKLTGRYFNINLMYRTPYNAGTVPSISFQYGYRFKLKKNK